MKVKAGSSLESSSSGLKMHVQLCHVWAVLLIFTDDWSILRFRTTACVRNRHYEERDDGFEYTFDLNVNDEGAESGTQADKLA